MKTSLLKYLTIVVLSFLTMSGISFAEAKSQVSYPNEDTPDGFIYPAFEENRTLTTNILPWRKNNWDDVIKLQSFFNEYEQEKLEITGTYDTPTIEAVNRFQVKYARAILKPWGLTKPTGNVGKMTRAYINNIIYGTSRKISCPGLSDNIKIGQVSPDLPYIRRFLVHLGYSLSDTTSYDFDWELEQVVKQFQRDNAENIGLKNPTGRWGAQTKHAANMLVGCDLPELYFIKS